MRKRSDKIKSILDNDLYKFTMGAAVLLLYPLISVIYRFTDRGANGKWTQAAVDKLQAKINAMSKLRLKSKERSFCEKAFPWINRSYWDFLTLYRFDPSEVKVWLDEEQNLQVKIEGLWCRTILWEVPLLALISSTYYEEIDTNWNEDGQEEKMQAKAERLFAAGVLWGDFGTRRRRHFEAQERVVRIATKYSNFTGTSNVYLAMLYGIKALGTVAHEWVMAHSAMFGIDHANKYALEAWNHVFQGNLGTALPDTFGTEVFLRDFNLMQAKLYDSVRHDSGNPYDWSERMIAHYEKLKVDWKTKPFGYTDGNSDLSAIEIHQWVATKGGKCWFGIGTFMTNDYGPASPALRIVIKLSVVIDTEGRQIHVVKLSDTPEKATGHPDAIRAAFWTLYGRPLDSELNPGCRKPA